MRYVFSRRSGTRPSVPMFREGASSLELRLRPDWTKQRTPRHGNWSEFIIQCEALLALQVRAPPVNPYKHGLPEA